jgi:hypothetical protein
MQPDVMQAHRWRFALPTTTGNDIHMLNTALNIGV